MLQVKANGIDIAYDAAGDYYNVKVKKNYAGKAWIQQIHGWDKSYKYRWYGDFLRAAGGTKTDRRYKVGTGLFKIMNPEEGEHYFVQFQSGGTYEFISKSTAKTIAKSGRLVISVTPNQAIISEECEEIETQAQELTSRLESLLTRIPNGTRDSDGDDVRIVIEKLIQSTRLVKTVISTIPSEVVA